MVRTPLRLPARLSEIYSLQAWKPAYPKNPLQNGMLMATVIKKQGHIEYPCWFGNWFIVFLHGL